MNPTTDYKARYPTPDAVLLDPALETEDKLRVLCQWRLDAERSLAARSEGMSGGPTPPLGAIDRALHQLDEP
jgi:hypothetical protein